MVVGQDDRQGRRRPGSCSSRRSQGHKGNFSVPFGAKQPRRRSTKSHVRSAGEQSWPHQERLPCKERHHYGGYVCAAATTLSAHTYGTVTSRPVVGGAARVSSDTPYEATAVRHMEMQLKPRDARGASRPTVAHTGTTGLIPGWFHPAEQSTRCPIPRREPEVGSP